MIIKITWENFSHFMHANSNLITNSIAYLPMYCQQTCTIKTTFHINQQSCVLTIM